MKLNLKLVSFLVLMMTTSLTFACFNRGTSVSSSSASSGVFGPGGFNGQQVSSSVQCNNGVCTHQQSQQTFG